MAVARLLLPAIRAPLRVCVVFLRRASLQEQAAREGLHPDKISRIVGRREFRLPLVSRQFTAGGAGGSRKSAPGVKGPQTIAVFAADAG